MAPGDREHDKIGASPGPRLTPKLARVLDLLISGVDDAEIALRLGMSPVAVAILVGRLLRAAGAATREGLLETPVTWTRNPPCWRPDRPVEASNRPECE